MLENVCPVTAATRFRDLLGPFSNTEAVACAKVTVIFAGVAADGAEHGSDHLLHPTAGEGREPPFLPR